MIIHFKRFQFTQHFRRKLRNIDVDKLRDDCREEDASWISNADDGRSPETLFGHIQECA
jgi:hypothetical protein